MTLVEQPTNSPRMDALTAMTEIGVSVPLSPCWDPWAARMTLLVPGLMHIGTMNTRVAIRSAMSMTNTHSQLACSQSLVDIGPQVFDVLYPDAHPDEPGDDSGLEPDFLWDKGVAGVEGALH